MVITARVALLYFFIILHVGKLQLACLGAHTHGSDQGIPYNIGKQWAMLSNDRSNGIQFFAIIEFLYQVILKRSRMN